MSREDQKNPPSFVILSRLTIFLSWIGIHRFYVGKYISGSVLIVLFFTSFTLESYTQGHDNQFQLLLAFTQIASWAIQIHDLFKVSFGFFQDTEGTPIALSIDSAVASKIQYGPLLIWGVFAGIFGAHNFYAKKYRQGFFQLFTLGGLAVWWIYDLVLLTRGDFQDAHGRRVAHLYSKDPHIDVQS